MAIEIRGADAGPALRARIWSRMDATLGRIGVAPVRALVTFLDDDGPKGGPAGAARSRCESPSDRP